MSLRDQCIEAAAKSGYAGDAWEVVDDVQRLVWWSAAEVALDAILDVLEANADELRDNIDVAAFHVSSHQIAALVAALRGERVDQ